MPAETTIEAPSSAAQAPVSAPPSSAQSEIRVAPAATATDPGTQSPPPKPGSAKARMFDELRKKAGIESETRTETRPDTSNAESDTSGQNAETSEGQESGQAEKPAGNEKPITEAAVDKKKTSPWKLVDQYKAKIADYERQIAESKKATAELAKLKDYETKLAEFEKRNKELDEEIKYVNYSKSAEFQEKYQKPYEDAWRRWMGDLGELKIQDSASGSERPLAPQDLLQLVNMPLQKAREVANEVFGDFADDVMAARKEIRGLFDNQQRALDEARKLGAERSESMARQAREQQEALNKTISETWTKSNEQVLADEKIGRLFKPVEGDEEGNKRLQRGYEMADRAFSVNPLDPNLTSEQRIEIVKLHAAVRNRSAAFGRLSYQNAQLEAKLKAAMDEIAKYKSVQPGNGEGTREQSTTHTGSARDSVMGALRKLAH